MLVTLAMTMMLQSEVIKPDCGGSTLEVNACVADKLDRANKALEKYVQAATDRHTDENGKSDSVALGIQASQSAFEAYRDIECDAVFEDWIGGTIRTVMSLECRLRLTDERTHTVWENWLRYMDSTPPILPEPKPTV